MPTPGAAVDIVPLLKAVFFFLVAAEPTAPIKCAGLRILLSFVMIRTTITRGREMSHDATGIATVRRSHLTILCEVTPSGSCIVLEVAVAAPAK